MIDYLKTLLASQHVAALRMVKDAVAACPADHWHDPVGTAPFAGVAYHALVFADLYLSPSESAFTLRDVHRRGGDPRVIGFNAHVTPGDTLAYADDVIAKVADVMAAETEPSLRAHCGFSWLTITRGELHVYNTRHVQHHVGGLATVVRRLLGADVKPDPMDWVDHADWPNAPRVLPL